MTGAKKYLWGFIDFFIFIGEGGVVGAVPAVGGA